jgi:hypothetical protein
LIVPKFLALCYKFPLDIYKRSAFLLHQSLPQLFRGQKNEEKEGLKRNLGGVDLAIKSILWKQFKTRFHPPA